MWNAGPIFRTDQDRADFRIVAMPVLCCDAELVRLAVLGQGIRPVEVIGTSPEQTAAFVKSDMATIAKVIKDAGIPTER